MGSHSRSRPYRYMLATGIALALAALACNMPGCTPAAPPTVSPTPAAGVTQVAGQTPAGGVTVAPPPTSEAAITPTPTTAPSPTPPPTATVCNYDAAFVSDVTIPDGTQIVAGAAFTKTWRMSNSGCLNWPGGTTLVFRSGEQMGGPASVPAPALTVGSSGDVSVSLVAPSAPGSYRGNWQLQAGGALFGPTIYVDIVVVAPTATFTPAPTITPTPTNTLIPTNTPAPVTYSTKLLDIGQTYTADLDEGVVAPAAGDVDIWFEAVTSTEKYVTPRNGTLVAIWGTGAPGMYDCYNNSSLANVRIPLGSLPVGTYVCYKTNLGRPGVFRVNAISAGTPQTLSIGYTTWNKP